MSVLSDRPHARRLVHLAEGSFHPKEAKTSVGVIRYGIHQTAAIIDSTRAGKTSREAIGIGGDAPIVSSLAEAMKFKPDCLLLGTAPRGGALPDSWRAVVLEAIHRGLDVYSGLHTFLSDDPEFSTAAQHNAVRLWDVRKAPKGIPVGSGACRKAKSHIVLTVGSDCSVGKMTATLEVQRALNKRGKKAEFVATGQTGILIAGKGYPIDAIPGDFMAGAVETDCLAVDGTCDIICVEGQGSLIHPGFSAVTLGILHGCMPDALIVCHQPSRKEVAREYGIPIPPLTEVGRMHAQAVGWIKPTAVIGIALATYDLDEAAANDAVQKTAEETGLPVTDPVRYGPDPLVEAVLAHRKSIGKGE